MLDLARTLGDLFNLLTPLQLLDALHSDDRNQVDLDSRKHRGNQQTASPAIVYSVSGAARSLSESGILPNQSFPRMTQPYTIAEASLRAQNAWAIDILSESRVKLSRELHRRYLGASSRYQ